MFVATKAKGEHVALVTHEKDRELGTLVPDFALRIEDVRDERDPKWGRQVMHVDRGELKARAPTGDAKLSKALASVRECIKSHPGGRAMRRFASFLAARWRPSGQPSARCELRGR
jgi:hypothetical protein